MFIRLKKNNSGSFTVMLITSERVAGKKTPYPKVVKNFGTVATEEEALKLAATTWPKDIKQEVHYSESKALHENNPKEKPQAHSMYIKSIPNTYGLDVDIMVEAKGKELAILPFIK